MVQFLNQRNILTAATVFLLLLFSYPSWVGLLAVVTRQMETGRGLGSEFFILLVEPTSVWDAIRSGVALLVAAVVAAEFSIDSVNTRAGVAMAALALCLAPTIILFLYLTPDRGGNLWNQVDQSMLTAQIDSTASFARVWNAYLTGQLQVLGGSFLLFLGVSHKK